MIINPTSGKVLLLRRTDVKDSEAWQLPQGGLRLGETPQDAVVREVAEETGLTASDYTVAHEIDEWLVYELPPDYRSVKTGRGQAQKWFLLEVHSKDLPVKPDRVEFDSSRWVPLEDVVSLVPPFRRAIYRRLVEVARHLLPKYQSGHGLV